MKFLFPEGHKTKDLTRLRDGKQLILHYIPYIEIVEDNCEIKHLKVSCTKIFRYSGQQGDLVCVQLDAPTRGLSFKEHKSEPTILHTALD